MKLIYIAIKMIFLGVSIRLVVNALYYSFEYEGIIDLMEMWNDWKEERKEIINDLKELLSDF